MKIFKFCLTFFLGISSLPALAASFECTAKMDGRSIVLRDGGAASKKAALILKEATWETHCPFSRGKIENKVVKGVRKITVLYKRAGNCSPNSFPGKTQRAALNLVIEIKGQTMTASFDDPNKNSGAPCELNGFAISSLGLKK